jgi:hypothetical protein
MSPEYQATRYFKEEQKKTLLTLSFTYLIASSFTCIAAHTVVIQHSMNMLEA